MAEHVTSEESELYALGVLDGEEKEAFETHLRSCDDCTRGVASAHQRVALIGLACVPETPRPAVREKIMRRIMADRAGDWSQERNAQITELRVEREPEPEPVSKPHAKPTAVAVAEPEPEPEPDPEPIGMLLTEGPERRMPWLAAGLAVLVLAGSAGLWMIFRSHPRQAQFQAQQQTQASQPSATSPAENVQSGQRNKAVIAQQAKPSAQKSKAQVNADDDPAAVAEQPADSPAAPQPETLALAGPKRIAAGGAHTSDTAAPPSLAIGADFGTGRGAGLPNLPGATAEPPVQAAPSGPMRVSSGVASARLVSPIQAIYPDIARESRVQGSVVVDATISTNGRIKNAHVESGPALLREAALSAVQRARYRPFMLNGAPVEAETAITLVFKLN